MDNLNINLKLGAIPSFYFYRDGNLVGRIISGSHLKLESFIDTYYVGHINANLEDMQDPNSPAIIVSSNEQYSNSKILAVFKCSNCDQYGHRTKDCKEKVSKVIQVVQSSQDLPQ